MQIQPLQKALAQECKALEEQNGDLSTAFQELGTYADTLESQLHAAGLLQEGGVADEAAAAAADEAATAASAPSWQCVILDYNPWDDLFFHVGLQAEPC